MLIIYLGIGFVIIGFEVNNQFELLIDLGDSVCGIPTLKGTGFCWLLLGKLYLCTIFCIRIGNLQSFANLFGLGSKLKAVG